MIEFFYQMDSTFFYFINHSIANPFFDKFFTIITDVKHWYIAYIILWLILFIKGGRKGKIAAAGAIFLIVFSDQVTANLIKDIFQRIRPCNVLEDVRLLIGCSKSYSMPSSHAVNNFAIATYFSVFYPRYKWILFTVSSLVAISRPYVGVHYPSDIIVGTLIGMIFGFIFVKLTVALNEKITARFKLIK